MKYCPFIFFLVLFPLVFKSVLANEAAVNYLEYLPLENPEAQKGQIVVQKEGKFSLSSRPYQEEIYGVISPSQAKSIELKAEKNVHPVASQGVVFVSVSTLNGAIAYGDKITTSEIPGVGMKSSEAGMVVGYAQENLAQTDRPQLIPVLLHIHKASKDKPKLVLNSEKLPFIGGSAGLGVSQDKIVRYLFSSFLTIFCIVVGILTFGRLAFKGVESIGRNPMAKKTILMGIVINSVITVVIILAGLIGSYLILVS